MPIFKAVATFLAFAIFVAVPSLVFGDVISSINDLTDAIPSDSKVLAVLTLVAGLVIEVIVRLKPSLNPRGWLVFIAAVLTAVEALVKRLKEFFVKLQGLSDKVLPQNIASGESKLIDKKP